MLKRNKDPQKTSLRVDLANFSRGLLMGGADVIPGVSGGTIALIVGIYQRLVNSLSHFDLTLLRHVQRKQWRQAADRVDFRFLAALGLGIGSGVLALGGLMHWLLTNEQLRQLTLSAFFGTILASSVLVARMVHVRDTVEIVRAILLGIAGAAFAFWLTGLPPMSAELSNAYIFMCGVVAICAMILPGISGAYVLLILGAYLHMSDMIHRLPKLDISTADAFTVACFCSGCAIGLVAFSKVLRWLLARHQPQTMAVLCGCMLGALRRIWPFQVDLTPEETDFSHKLFANVMPDAVDSRVVLCVAIAVVAMLLVFILDRATHGHEQRPLTDK